MTSLNSFTGSFRELGPPDLVHTIKTSGRTGSKDVSSSITNLTLENC